MGIKQAIESVLGTNEPAAEEPIEEVVEEKPKAKSKRKSNKDKFQDNLKVCIEVLEDEQEEMLEDVDGDLSRIGAERLEKYQAFDKVIAKLRKHLK